MCLSCLFSGVSSIARASIYANQIVAGYSVPTSSSYNEVHRGHMLDEMGIGGGTSMWEISEILLDVVFLEASTAFPGWTYTVLFVFAGTVLAQHCLLLGLAALSSLLEVPWVLWLSERWWRTEKPGKVFQSFYCTNDTFSKQKAKYSIFRRSVEICGKFIVKAAPLSPKWVQMETQSSWNRCPFFQLSRNCIETSVRQQSWPRWLSSRERPQRPEHIVKAQTLTTCIRWVLCMICGSLFVVLHMSCV